MGHALARRCGALLGHRPCGELQRRALLLVVGSEVGRAERIDGGAAADRCALPDTTRVDADDVEARGHLVADRETPTHPVPARSARTARVHDPRADPLPGLAGWSLDERDRARKSVVWGKSGAGR